MGACALETMADHLESKDESTSNPCCSLWKDKFLKSQQKCKSTEERRAALKKAVDVLMKQVDMMQNENLKLNKAYEEEKMQSDREKKEKEKESAARVSLGNEISAFKSEIFSLSEQLKALRGCVSDKDKDLNCLREQLQKKTADEMCHSSKADQELRNLKERLLNLETEKKKLIKDVQKERARADLENKRVEEMLKAAKTEPPEVELVKNNSHLSTLKFEELGQLKVLLDKEKKRADSEKKNANKVKEMLKAEQSRVDEQRKLVDVEKRKAEEISRQLQRLKCEVDEAKSKLVSESSKFTEANQKKLEAEKKKTIKDKKKAEEQQKIAEMSTKHALEEKQRAVRFQQELEEYQKKYDKLKKDIEQEKSIKTNTANGVRNGVDLKREKEAELKKAIDMYKLQAMKEKSRADNLAHQLEVTKKRTTNESEEISEKMTTSAEMKLLKKRLKLEKERVKHANQVAELEKRCKKTVEQELHQLKLEFTRFSNRIGLCSCFDGNVGKSCLEKNDNVNLKREFMQTESGKELVEATKSSKYLKPNLSSPALSLPMTGTFTESTSGTASKMEPLLNRKKLDNSALSSMASFSDRQLVVSNLQLPISRLSSVMADNNVKSPPKVRKRKRLLNAIEPIEHLSTEGKTPKVAKNTSELHGMLGQNDKPLKEGMHSDIIQQNEEWGIIAVGDKDVVLENTCSDDLEHIKNLFDSDYMKLLDLDSEVEEGKFRAALERPLSPTLPNIESENNGIGSDDSRPSESWSIAVFPDIRDSNNLSKIFHMTKTFSSQLCATSQTDNVVKNIVSALSVDESLLPKEKACVFFSLFLKSLPNIDLTNFNNVNCGNFLDSINIFSGQLKKGMSDVETRTMFTKACDLDEVITLVQSFIINENVLVCTDITSETPSLPDSKASLHQLVVGAVFLASICADFDRIDSICETSYTVSGITSCSSTLTVLHVFAFVCGKKLLAHSDYSLVMTVVKSLVTYCETETLASGFPLCARCPFFEGAVSMEDLSSLLLKRLNGCCMHNFGIMTYKSITVPDGVMSNLGDVLSLLELLASKMSWGWVCENIISGLLKLLEVCVMEVPLTAVFVLLGQMARLGIDANGFEDPGVENIRVKLTSFISQSTSRKIGLPIQLASVNALLGTIPLRFQEICKNRLEVQTLVSCSTATDSIQKWFSLLSDKHKCLSLKLLTADVS